MAHFKLLFTILLPFLLMKTTAAQEDATCSDDWSLFGDHCYQIQPNLADWDVAKQICLDLGSELIVVSSIEENSFVSSLAITASSSTDKKTWMNCNNRGRSLDDWVCGEDNHNMTYSNWHTSEPNGSGDEHCAEIYTTLQGVWNDKECYAPRNVICEKRAWTGSARFQGLQPRALGVENGIPDASFSSSSSWPMPLGTSVVNAEGRAQRGRLNSIEGHGGIGGWSAIPQDPFPWIQVILNEISAVTAVATQGRNGPHAQWVTSYEVGCSLDGLSFSKINFGSDLRCDTMFHGNNDQNTVLKKDFQIPYVCRYVRIYPLTFYSRRSMRFEVYGVPLTSL